MTMTSTSHIKRKILLVTMLLFVLGVLVVFRTGTSIGISNAQHLFSILAASYLIAWGGYALLSRVPRDEIRSQFVLMTLSLGLGLAVLEAPVSVGWIDYRAVFATPDDMPWSRPGFVPDQELLALPQPHLTVKTNFTRGNIGEHLCLPRRPALPFELKFDKNGFRNERDLDSANIILVGDSYVESPMIPHPMLLTSRLAELQQKSVVNLGQSGYGPQQELAVLKRYALLLRPQTIIWVFYEGNDLHDLYAYDELSANFKEMVASSTRLWDQSFTRNALLGLGRRWQGCVPDKSVTKVIGTVSDQEGKAVQLYFLEHAKAAPEFIGEEIAIDKAVSMIATGYELARRNGSRFVVAFAPTKFRVYHDIATFDEASERIRGTWWREIAGLPERIENKVRNTSLDIEWVDLTPALKSGARKGNPVFLPDDTHWSSEGHRVVAEALAGALTVGTQMSVEQQPSEPQKKKKDIALLREVMMVRNGDGTIRYWSEGAQNLYGWEPQHALGATSHRLLKTVFPASLEVIEAELRAKGYWDGQLIHERRDGSKVTVASHWELQQNPSSKDQSITVIEINSRPKP